VDAELGSGTHAGFAFEYRRSTEASGEPFFSLEATPLERLSTRDERYYGDASGRVLVAYLAGKAAPDWRMLARPAWDLWMLARCLVTYEEDGAGDGYPEDWSVLNGRRDCTSLDLRKLPAGNRV
jgi:hypothetical protein